MELHPGQRRSEIVTDPGKHLRALPDLPIDPGPHPGQGGRHQPDLAGALDRDRDLARDLAHTITRDLDRALDPALDLARTLALDLTRPPAGDLAYARAVRSVRWRRGAPGIVLVVFTLEIEVAGVVVELAEKMLRDQRGADLSAAEADGLRLEDLQRMRWSPATRWPPAWGTGSGRTRFRLARTSGRSGAAQQRPGRATWSRPVQRRLTGRAACSMGVGPSV